MHIKLNALTLLALHEKKNLLFSDLYFVGKTPVTV